MILTGENRLMRPSPDLLFLGVLLFLGSGKAKRGRREGDGKKNVTTICDKRHDNL